MVHGEPCGHVGHAGIHEGVRGDIRTPTSEAAGRLLCMGTLLHEAYPCMDQHGVLGTEGNSGRGYRQVQATVSIQVLGGATPLGLRGSERAIIL